MTFTVFYCALTFPLQAVNLKLIKSERLLLLCTLRQVLVFEERSGRVVGQLRLSAAAPAAPPLVDWHLQLLPVTEKLVERSARVCCVRGNELRLYTVRREGRASSCPLVKVLRLAGDALICNVAWLDDHHLLALDSKETARLLDVHSGALLASVELGDAQLAYSSADFKVGATIM